MDGSCPALTRSALILWPLLTPLGSFFNAVDSGDIELPWASIAGFLDVLAVMAVAVWLGSRHARKMLGTETPAAPPQSITRPRSDAVPTRICRTP